MSGRPRVAALDWLKAIGILLILVGHLAARWNNGMAPPIFPKQLGVAFFVFATGFTLARETRPPALVVYRRLFEVLLFGLAVAAAVSVKGLLTDGDARLFNYLPFAGACVVFDRFPPNPTTWYVATYLHILVLWALVVRRVDVTLPILVVSSIVEVAVRAVLMERAGLHVAYMLATNWMTVFLLGLHAGQRRAAPGPTAAIAALALVAVLMVWPFAVSSRMAVVRGDLFQHFGGSTILTSIGVSFMYLAYTYVLFHLTARATAPPPIRFLARNTLLVFVAHMPLYFVLNPVLRVAVPNYHLRAIVLLVVCGAGLAWVSEILRRVVRPEALRELVWASCAARPRFADGAIDTHVRV